MAIERVAKRVCEGGHNIPTETIIRRYWLGLQNFFKIFAPILDSWMFLENENKTVLIANNRQIRNSRKFLKIQESCLNRKN